MWHVSPRVHILIQAPLDKFLGMIFQIPHHHLGYTHRQ